MKPKLYTYNSTAINDGTNYNAFIQDDIKLQGSATITNVSRSGRRPVYASKTLKDYEMKIVIEMLGTVSSQLDTLKALFDIEDETPRKLIIKDTANSDKQWYVYATVKEMPKLKNRLVYITLSIADPVWYSETLYDDTWNIAASGETNEIVVGGNVAARPIFVITPTAAGGSRYAYRRLALWRNPITYAQLNYPLNIVGTVWDTAALVADVTRSVVINDGDGITDSDVTITYDGETGTFPASGMAYLGTEQISYTGKTATELTGVTRGINGTTAASHANNTIIYASKIQANGDDIRVYLDGMETNRWLQDMNTANTKIWISLDLSAGIDMTLGTAIASTGDVDTITLANTKANITAIKKIPASGMVYIESELYSYSGVNTKSRQLTGCVRAINDTLMAAHTSGTAVYWIEHEIWVYYGNSTVGAPETDDTKKPIIDLTSTNTSWVYTSFFDEAGVRSGIWKPALVKTANSKDPDHKSGYYTGNRLADADPATEMGAAVYAWLSGVMWKAENATVDWVLYNPATMTEITLTGEKYRANTHWPASAKFYKSTDGKKWDVVWTEATPSAAATWEALASHSAVSLGTGSKYIKMSFSGTVGATAGNYAAHEIEAATVTLASANVPQGIFVDPAEDIYYLNCTITNNTTGEWMTVVASLLLDTPLVVNCEDKLAYTDNLVPITSMTFSSIRKDWLNVSGTTELQFDDTGTAGVTFRTFWRDRNS